MKEELKLAAYERALNVLACEALRLGVDADALRQKVASSLLQAEGQAGTQGEEASDLTAQAILLAKNAIAFAQKDGDVPQ